MHIERFYDDGLAHASYAVLSDKQVALVDPARNPQPYLDFAGRHEAIIVAVVETHLHADFKAGHLPGAVNIMDGKKFETWLGSIIGPEEEFYLLADSNEAVEGLIRKAAKIGYEKNIKGALQAPTYAQ